MKSVDRVPTYSRTVRFPLLNATRFSLGRPSFRKYPNEALNSPIFLSSILSPSNQAEPAPMSRSTQRLPSVQDNPRPQARLDRCCSSSSAIRTAPGQASPCHSRPATSRSRASASTLPTAAAYRPPGSRRKTASFPQRPPVTLSQHVMNNTMHDFTADLPSKTMNDGSHQARTIPSLHAATTMNAAIPNNEYFTAISTRPIQSRRSNTAGDAHFTSTDTRRLPPDHRPRREADTNTPAWGDPPSQAKRRYPVVQHDSAPAENKALRALIRR